MPVIEISVPVASSPKLSGLKDPLLSTLRGLTLFSDHFQLILAVSPAKSPPYPTENTIISPSSESPITTLPSFLYCALSFSIGLPNI